MTSNRSRVLARELLALGLVVLMILSVKESMTRGLAFVSVRGVIIELETRTEKHPGIDDRHFVTVATDEGQRTLEIGADVASRLRVGAKLDTMADARGFLLDGEDVVVTHPDEGWAVGLALAIGMAWILLASALRGGSSGPERGVIVRTWLALLLAFTVGCAPPVFRGQQKRTVSNMRALEAALVQGTNGQPDRSAPSLPGTDEWGNKWRIEQVDGDYLIASPGADGVYGAATERVIAELRTGPVERVREPGRNADYVLFKGTLVVSSNGSSR